MSHLFLVRHGQATFPYQDQDHLTGIGQAQAQLLGCFWAAEKIEFDQVYSGPGGRHLETADLAGKALRDFPLWPLRDSPSHIGYTPLEGEGLLGRKRLT